MPYTVLSGHPLHLCRLASSLPPRRPVIHQHLMRHPASLKRFNQPLSARGCSTDAGSSPPPHARFRPHSNAAAAHSPSAARSQTPAQLTHALLASTGAHHRSHSLFVHVHCFPTLSSPSFRGALSPHPSLTHTPRENRTQSALCETVLLSGSNQFRTPLARPTHKSGPATLL
jgi:hypothetical protein